MIGILAPDSSGVYPITPPIVTVTEIRRWLVSVIYEQKTARADEAKMELFFLRTQLPKEETSDGNTPTHTERLGLANKLAVAITPGMTRAEVEKIFPQSDGGAIGSDRGRYYFGSEVMVDVPFDTTGGPFHSENKVSGPLRVYQDMMHYD